MTDTSDRLVNMAQIMNTGSPQAVALGLRTIEIEHARVVMTAPYREDLIGNPETGVIAGGVVTTMLDHASGQAVYAAMDLPEAVATLDLRIDYMRRAEPGRDLFVEAHCYKLTHAIAFVRAIAYDLDKTDPVATAQSAFMLNSSAGRPAGANLKPPSRKTKAAS